MNTKYANAIKEVLHYLNGIKEEDFKKIPEEFLEYLKENASKEYICDFDYTKPLKELNISKEAKGLITIICYDYWCETKEQKQDFLEKINLNEAKFQDELRKKYSVENFIDNSVRNNKEINIQVCKESKLQKIYLKIKKLIAKIIKK